VHAEGFFYQAFIYLAAAVISVPLAKRLGLGSVLGYLIAGTAIGPFGLGLIGSEGQDVMHFAEFGVVMMLFLVGLELRPALLWQMRGPILGLGGLQGLFTSAMLCAVGLVLGLPWQTALACGMILTFSSTAIGLQTLSEKGLVKTDAGQKAFGVLLFQDVSVIPLLAAMPLLATGVGSAADAEHGGAWVDHLPAWAQTLAVLGAVALIVVLGRYLLRPAFRFIARARIPEVFTAASLLLVIGIALLMTRVGLSPALGTFLAGVVLAGSEYRHELESDIGPFKGLLLGLFFISVGASIDFALVRANPGLISGLVATLVVGKFVVLLALARGTKMGLDQSLLFAFVLAQGSEFAFVLLSFARQTGVVTDALASPLVAVVALSMGLTPLLMLLNDKLIRPRVGTKEKPEREMDTIEEDNPAIVAGFGRFGHIIGRFLVANGVGTTILDSDSDHVEFLRKLGVRAFYGDASRHDLLVSAGAEKAKLLILAIDDHEKMLRIVETVRKHFPHLRILARARGRPNAYDLLDAGVEHVYRETLDSSLRVGVDALRLLGYRAYQAHRAGHKFRQHDEASVRELAAMRHDRKAYFSRARESIRDAEKLMQTELQGAREVDGAWDASALRRETDQSSTD
jgi:monovalent cation:proton antiporter-2 (CPA2) family protein